ncbi:MAG: SDR family NAD(P)-dependent oxidoreductase [Clostridia bacterium]|nr:SDR family NAD(P)-dependent oxidoreductase [Clostridia bacterium]
MKIAVVTGASSGLGKEYVRVIEESFQDIEEIWVIARRRERLEALSELFPKKRIAAVPLDLTDPESFDVYRTRLAQEKPEVMILVNNSGAGTFGDFREADTDSQVSMTQLNVTALTAMASITLPYMPRGALLINISSIASFVPTPGMTVYCSTKAYVQSFSRSLAFELKKAGIHCLAVCPGPMDTEFLDVAGITGRSETFRKLPRVNAAKVAEKSVSAAVRGKFVYTPRFIYKVYRVLAKILPHRLVMHISKIS